MTRDQRRTAARGSWGSLVATVVALGWARLWRAEVRYDASYRLFVATGMRGGFARAGTTVGGVYLTGSAAGDGRLRHEAVHAEQWARHGLTFPFRYWLEELRHRGPANRFEVEAGLADGGYARERRP